MSTLVSTRMPQVLSWEAAFQQLDPSIYWCMGLFLPAAGLCTFLCWIAQGCSWLMGQASQGPSEWGHNPLMSQPLLYPAHVSPSPDAAQPADFLLAFPAGDSFSTAAYLLHKSKHLSLTQDREQLWALLATLLLQGCLPKLKLCLGWSLCSEGQVLLSWRMHPVAQCHIWKFRLFWTRMRIPSLHHSRETTTSVGCVWPPLMSSSSIEG